MREPVKIDMLINNMCRKKHWDDKLIWSKILEVWENIIGSTLANKLQIVRFKEGKLFIKTNSSSWRAEIQLRKEKIIKDINTALYKEFHKDIIENIIIR